MIRIALIASFVAALVSVGAWYWLAQSLPANTGLLPVHWGASGQADGFASRDDALKIFGLLPGINVLIALLLCAIPAIEPLRENIQRAKGAYVTVWVGVQFILSLIAIGVALATLQAAGAAPANAGLLQSGLIAIGALFVIVVGDVLPKTKPNFFLGVRTPWTLTSDLSWERTHRLMGRLFVLIGIWGAIAAFVLHGQALTIGLIAPIIVSALIAVVYSYFVWRNDPDRRRPPQQA